MRECGTCTACCTLTRVPELNKPERVTCANCAETGCTIYETRPASCRSFMCAWLAGDMADEHRPDLSGVMVERLPTTRRTVIALTALPDTPIPAAMMAHFTGQGMAIAATGGRAYLPEGMSHNDMRNDLFLAAAELGV